jgi:pyruvate ferredoxin oxidoreductase gamma subunit
MNVAEGLEKGGILLVNTAKSEKEIAKELDGSGFDIRMIDASGIALELLGKNLPNTVIVGAVAKLIPSISKKDVILKMKGKLGAKLPAEVMQKNLEALEKGYEEA